MANGPLFMAFDGEGGDELLIGAVAPRCPSPLLALHRTAVSQGGLIVAGVPAMGQGALAEVLDPAPARRGDRLPDPRDHPPARPAAAVVPSARLLLQAAAASVWITSHSSSQEIPNDPDHPLFQRLCDWGNKQ
jgi:hypothetical protein